MKDSKAIVHSLRPSLSLIEILGTENKFSMCSHYATSGNAEAYFCEVKSFPVRSNSLTTFCCDGLVGPYALSTLATLWLRLWSLSASRAFESAAGP